MGIFAHVLKQILTAHQGDDYSHLGGIAPRGDPIWYPLRRLAISPEVISRLKDAADSNDKRATLSPADLEYAMDQLRFRAEEREQLRAALMAQGVEMLVGDRLPSPAGSTAAAIAVAVYAQLLSHFEDEFNRVREDAGVYLSRSPRALAQVRALAQHAATLLWAQSTAQTQQLVIEAAYWLDLAITAYEHVSRVAQPLEPEIADVCRQIAVCLRAARVPNTA